eukprot:TRINITY_DN3533_c1_g1_i1.p1 TRINITY_DN3533_c1_g1~~TRINITY_DN3533_c1_g1_i1.p1  ORF type:complete len:372 (+),score=70.24 TRINITY_DN3533_c1_g1_i1:30-1118(+)
MKIVVALVISCILFFCYQGQAQEEGVSSSAQIIISNNNQGSGREAASSQLTTQLPVGVQEYTHVLYGEDGAKCQGTTARVFFQNGSSFEEEEVVKEAVANAVLQNYNEFDESRAAEDSAVAILEVISKAQGSVNVEVVSASPGCWGIAYGRAYASAVAAGTATAISQSVAKAVGSSANAEVDVIAQAVSKNVSEVVESVAAMVARGNGTSAFMDKEVVAEAKVKVMVCALARAYAAAKQGEARAAAIAITGCDQIKPTFIPKDIGEDVQCACKTFGSQPKGCGIHGINQNNPKDYICYVKNRNCFCSQRSNLYPGQFWRYCGETLKQMQKYLNIDNSQNGIFPPRYSNGFCGGLNPDLDPVS